MRHVLSILLQNESGALARVAAMFANRGFNIESLSVAATDDKSLSRLTLVTSGSEEVISQVNKQLNKLIDVVAIADRTESPHFERELGLFKLFEASGDASRLQAWASGIGAAVLDPDPGHFTIQVTGSQADLDQLLGSLPSGIQIVSVVRSGPLVIAEGPHALGAHGQAAG